MRCIEIISVGKQSGKLTKRQKKPGVRSLVNEWKIRGGTGRKVAVVATEALVGPTGRIPRPRTNPRSEQAPGVAATASIATAGSPTTSNESVGFITRRSGTPGTESEFWRVSSVPQQSIQSVPRRSSLGVISDFEWTMELQLHSGKRFEVNDGVLGSIT